MIIYMLFLMVITNKICFSALVTGTKTQTVEAKEESKFKL